MSVSSERAVSMMIGAFDDLAKLAGEVQPIHLGQPQVQHDQVGLVGLGMREGRLAVSRHLHIIAGALKIIADQLADFGFVVYNQDLLRHSFVLLHIFESALPFDLYSDVRRRLLVQGHLLATFRD